MVKFGRHLQFFLDNQHEGSSLYVVPYNNVRELMGDIDSFLAAWTESLQAASDDFYAATTAMWRSIFRGISELDECRGALPEVALRLYISVAGEEELQELLSDMKQLHATALTNSEALRKLVKKYDKEEGHEKLSPTLLPEVYAANFTVGQSTLEAALSVLRANLHMEEEDDDHNANQEVKQFGENEACLTCAEAPASYLNARRHKGRHDEAVELRKVELEWLRKMLSTIAPDELRHIVAHRGFHSPRDRSDRRPLENSLSAYEAAWTNGLKLCECDIALTKDEKLVLAHDEDFSRLALDPSLPESSVKVRDLTFRQLLSLPLKSGTRPPLLIDVLRSAQEIGGGSQLIVEIKPGNAEAGTALARLFLQHPDLMASCAVVMSFDAFAMHNLRREMVAVLEKCIEEQHGLAATMSLPTSMSFGNFSALPTTTSSQNMLKSSSLALPIYEDEPTGRHAKNDSADNVGMWLSESFNRKDSFNFSPFNAHLGASPGSTRRRPSFDTQASPRSTMRRRPSIDRSRGTLVSQSGAPKLMLLTVADPPKIPVELWADVADLTPVDQWLHASDGSLDGVYLQFQKQMLNPEGAAALRKLAEKCVVGVWGHNGRDPDDWTTFHWLVRECQVSYVNSDLPKTFKKILRTGVSSVA